MKKKATRQVHSIEMQPVDGGGMFVKHTIRDESDDPYGPMTGKSKPPIVKTSFHPSAPDVVVMSKGKAPAKKGKAPVSDTPPVAAPKMAAKPAMSATDKVAWNQKMAVGSKGPKMKAKSKAKTGKATGK